MGARQQEGRTKNINKQRREPFQKELLQVDQVQSKTSSVAHPHKCTWLSQDCGRLYFLLKPSRKRHHVALCATRGAPMKAWTRKVEQASSQCDILEMFSSYLSPRPKINLGFGMTMTKAQNQLAWDRRKNFFSLTLSSQWENALSQRKIKARPRFSSEMPWGSPSFSSLWQRTLSPAARQSGHEVLPLEQT